MQNSEPNPSMKIMVNGFVAIQLADQNPKFPHVLIILSDIKEIFNLRNIWIRFNKYNQKKTKQVFPQ